MFDILYRISGSLNYRKFELITLPKSNPKSLYQLIFIMFNVSYICVHVFQVFFDKMLYYRCQFLKFHSINYLFLYALLILKNEITVHLSLSSSMPRFLLNFIFKLAFKSLLSLHFPPSFFVLLYYIQVLKFQKSSKFQLETSFTLLLFVNTSHMNISINYYKIGWNFVSLDISSR